MTISIRELSKINEFVSDIDELYQTELIYRMILVYNKILNTYI